MLNNAAADTLFADTQLYENMNRLVKMLSYSPHGYITSAVETKISINDNLDKILPDYCVIPKFSCIDLGMTDSYR
jgi:hypothetical protein